MVRTRAYTTKLELKALGLLESSVPLSSSRVYVQGGAEN